MNTYTASYEGQTATENSNREYNFAAVVYIPWKNETVVGYRWSKTEKGARAGCLTAHQKAEGMRIVAVVPATVQEEAPVVEAAPAAEEAPAATVTYTDPGGWEHTGTVQREYVGSSGESRTVVLNEHGVTVDMPAECVKAPTTTVHVDIVEPGKALVHLSDRDGGTLIQEGAEWLAEDSYGTGETVGAWDHIEDATEALVLHLGVTGPLAITIDRE